MKALVYRQENKDEKLEAFLKDKGIEMKKVTEKFYTGNYPNTDEWFDLAIVDSRSDTAEAACRYIRETLNIPIILLVDSSITSWKGLLPMDADGYLSESKKGGELSARANALLRRLFLREKSKESKRPAPDGEDCMCLVR